MTKLEPLRILIADDHPMFRRGLRSLLAAQDDMEVVGEATNAAEAIQAAAALPDVILMDLHMPGGGALATREVVRLYPSVRVLVVTMFKDDDSVFSTLRAGAQGYVLKDADEEELLRAVRAVSRGEAIFSSEIAMRVLAYFARPPSHPRDVFPELTDREREVLGLIAKGHGNPEIARQLGLRLKTVANYASNIFSKLQVADRVEAMAKAQQVGLGKERDS